jgi:predicted MFS family arabinose efflux permease
VAATASTLRRGGRAVAAAASNPAFARLAAARLVSVTGRWAYTVTLGVYAYAHGGATAVAWVGLLRILPAALTAPFAWPMAMRFGVHNVLLGAGASRAAALAGAALLVHRGGPTWGVYILAGVESATSTTSRPLQNALLPRIARTPEELTSANLTLSTIEATGVFIGPAIGAILLTSTGVTEVFLVGAAAYVVSAILVRTVGHEPPAGEFAVHGHASIAHAALRGIRDVVSDPTVRLIVGLYGAQNLVAGALNVLIVVAALQLFHLGSGGVGTLTSAVGVGGLIGGVIVLGRLAAFRHGRDLTVGLVLWGLPLLLLAALPRVGTALVLLALVGVGVTLVDVSAVTLLQRAAPAQLLGQALGVVQALFVGSLGIGTLLAPVLIHAIGLRWSIFVTGALLPLLVAVLWRRLAHLDAGRVSERAVDLLLAIPIFQPLPLPTVEGVAALLEPVDKTAGSEVISEGAFGDRFYVVDDGQLDVLIAGEHVRTLGPGDYFGEIALLRDVPRTATVVARTQCALYALAREAFIAAVTGTPASRAAADSVVAARLGSLRVGFGTV